MQSGDVVFGTYLVGGLSESRTLVTLWVHLCCGRLRVGLGFQLLAEELLRRCMQQNKTERGAVRCSRYSTS